jgi:hypothetical protein
MSRFLIVFSFLITLCISSYSQEVEAGLNYQNYAAGAAQPTYTQDANGNITNRTLLSTGTVNVVGLTASNGTGIPTRSDGFIVRFYGFINIPTAGTYWFGGNADDGIRIKINNTLVVNSWVDDGGSFRSGSITLAAGVVPVEVMYYENGGGQMVNFQWYQNNAWQIVPSASLMTTAPAAPAYTSSITAEQQNRINSAASRLAGIVKNGIYIDQVGNNNTINVSQEGGYNQVSGVGATYAPVQGDLNTITIRQGDPGNPVGKNLIEMSVQGTGSNTLNLNQGRDTVGNYTSVDVGGHYQMINVSGYSNTVTTQQQNQGGSVGHYLEANVIGNYNTVGLVQTDGTTQKQAFATVSGNNNTVNASQTGVGAHYLDVSLTGNGNSAVVSQSGSTANAATISLVNAGGPASVNLIQTGGQTYSISTVCVQAGGCAPVTVRQGN